jgi:hypothetical protein
MKDWVENHPKDVVYSINKEILENHRRIPVGKKVMVGRTAVVVEDHPRVILVNP